MRTLMLLYPGFTALDAFGPYHGLAALPGSEFSFVAEAAGPVSDGGKIVVEAQLGIDEISACDLLIVPGGIPAVTMARTGHRLIDWIGAVDTTTTWTASVCTGSLMLGAAGLLGGRRATSHWYTRSELASHGAIPVDERVVIDGKYVTAAGVSAGIDMALTLIERIAGLRYAQGVQLDMEYDPAPPFTSGHPRSAPPDVTEWLTEMYDSMLAPGTSG